MDRELLIEIGCEEIPASWLPGLTDQLGQHLTTRLKAFRLTSDAPAETYSTPRRLTARVVELAERQTDFEELVLGPPVSAAFRDGQPTPAATGFGRKYGVEVPALERRETPRGEYLAHTVRQRGKATVDVLADVLAGVLRDMAFPKQMRWDAYLEDGKGDLPFARPIRWIVLLFGGRVVPFVIRRTELAQGPNVQDVASGASTRGHRFLTTSGRAGRALKVKTFEDYQARLLENFVILDRAEREQKIRRELETHARRLGGRVSSLVAAHSSLLQEVPDLVEYPSVVAGVFPVEFLQLPEEVLTTTMIHHQHYFPVVDDEGKLKPAFLAVTNMQPEKPELIARNSERVLTARLRDARFFWDEDRKATLESRIDRLGTILFHRKLGSYKEKAERVGALAEWIAVHALKQPEVGDSARLAGRLCKADLATDMVREFTELQGTMGGIYGREEGLPEAVWKAIYHHYLPVGVEANAQPSPQQLGRSATTWAAVSLADKLDSIFGLFVAGERPTGSRDPLGLRRQAQGVVRVMADLEVLTGLPSRPTLESIRGQAFSLLGHPTWNSDLWNPLRTFMMERIRHLMTMRGLEYEEIQATTGDVRRAFEVNVADLVAIAKALSGLKKSARLSELAQVYKRVNNIVEQHANELVATPWDPDMLRHLTEPAEIELTDRLTDVGQRADAALKERDFARALTAYVELNGPLARFFADVMVSTEDQELRRARLQLLADVRDRIREIADIAVMASQA